MSGTTKQTGRLPILMVNMFIAMLGMGLIFPVLPEFLKLFGASGKEAGTLVAVFGLAQFIFSPLAGKWSDKYGRKKLIIGGLALFSLSNLIFGMATDLWMLYLSRFIGGVGAAMMIPSMMAYVADTTTIETRGKGMGLIGASMSLGFVIGPGLGGILAELGVRAPFYVSAAVGTLAMVISIVMLSETLSVEQRLKLASSHVKGDHILKQFSRSFKATYWIYLLLVFIMTFGLINFESIFSLYFEKKYAYSTMDISLLITVGALMGVIIQSLLIGKLLKAFGEQKLIRFTLLSSSVILVVMIFSGNYWYVMLLTMTFFTLTAILRPAINTKLSKEAGEEQGFVAGMSNAYMSLGNIIGPTLAGFMFDAHTDYPFLIGGLVLFLSFILSVFWDRRKTGAAVKDDLALEQSV